MKKVAYLLLPLLFLVLSCKKTASTNDTDVVNIEAVRQANAAKVSITNGVWGTVSTIEGDCMPMFDVKTSTCKAYAIQREVRIYPYTNKSSALPAIPKNGLYDSFGTQPIKTITADAQGFFEISLPDGKYTIVFVEGGKLYSDSYDDQGGLSPVEVHQNKVNMNLVLQRAVY